MPQPLANGRQTYPSINEFCRMRMAQLMECTSNACLLTIVIPSLLNRLIAPRSSASILFCSEQRPMFVAHPFQIGPELLHQTRIVEQDRPSLVAFSHDGQMLIVEREIDILDIQR